MSSTRNINIIECPTGVGATFHGLSRGPAALVSAGITTKLEATGYYTITTHRPFGPIEGTIVNDPACISPQNVKDEVLAVEVNRQIKRQVLKTLPTPQSTVFPGSDSTSPRLDFALFLGGVCSMVPAIISAYIEALPQRKIGIIWFDADADLSLPEETQASSGFPGILAFMAFSQMTMRQGALQSMREFSAPIHKTSDISSHEYVCSSGCENVEGVANAGNTVFFGLNTIHPSVVPREHLTYLIDEHYRIFSSKALSRSIESARSCAKQALDHLKANGCDTIIVHVDVDAIDAREFPLGNVPSLTGLSFEGFIAALDVFIHAQNVVGLTLTEMNPDRDANLVMTTRLVDAVVESFKRVYDVR